MTPSQNWARSFSVEQQDVDFIINLLLEKETPLDTPSLARALIDKRLSEEATQLRERYQNARLYNPANVYTIGQKLIFSEFDYATGTVVADRPGDNPEETAFTVISVEFDDSDLNPPVRGGVKRFRTFVSDLKRPHELNAVEENNTPMSMLSLTTDDILKVGGERIHRLVEQSLQKQKDLVKLAQQWFPTDLLMEVNVGHLHLAEAVLDMMEGGPLPTAEILDQIGGLGKASKNLQIFSMNYALKDDQRFDEVGPSGEVLWYLKRLEPQDVLNTPPLLRYQPIEYNREMLTPDMVELEAEIGDELSLTEADIPTTPPNEVTLTLLYPHRRLGTLPLSIMTEAIFPTARRTPHIWFTLVDGQDGEEYPAWVVRNDRYVVGLAPFYRKHKLPVGASVTLKRSSQPGKISINFKSYKSRSEWVRVMIPKPDGIAFEMQRRGIGAEFDEMILLGADDLAGVDTLATQIQQNRRSLASLLKMLIPPLAGLTPQGIVHFKTLYSAVNALRRCPPGPILATLAANPEFHNEHGHYWKLSN